MLMNVTAPSLWRMTMPTDIQKAIEELRKLLDFTTKEHHEVVRAAAAVCRSVARNKMATEGLAAYDCSDAILSALEPEAKR